MSEDKFDRTMAEWAAREERAAPALEPPPEVRRRLRERWGSRGLLPFTRLVGWAAAAAGIVGLVLLLRALLTPAGVPGPDRLRLETWRIEKSVSVEGASLQSGRGPKKGPAAFLQLVFQHHRPGTETIFGVDLLAGPGDPVVLAAGDRYRVGLRPRGDRHVYAFQLGAGGGLVRLFPNATYAAVQNPLPGNAAQWLPAEPGWLAIEEARGRELVVLVASSEPLPRLRELWERHEQAASGEERAEVVGLVRSLVDALPLELPDQVEVHWFAFGTS
jgi:hypothetical protein